MADFLSHEEELKSLQSLEFVPGDLVVIRSIADLLGRIGRQVEKEEHYPNSSSAPSSADIPYSRRLSSSIILYAADTFSKIAAGEKVDSDARLKALNVYGYI
jgi:hypothetical protein